MVVWLSEPFARAHGVARQNFYPHYYVPGDTSSVEQLIRQPVMDPDYVSEVDFVDAARRGTPLAPGRVTPPALADRLERDNREALRLTGAIDTRGDASLRYEVADARTWAHLGLHLAEKLRARSRCTASVSAAA